MNYKLLKVLGISLSAISFVMIAPTVSAADIAGTYHCKGSDPYLNKNYTGTVTVTKQNDTAYSLEMTYDTGEKSIGTGIYTKNLMSVVFQDQSDTKNIGLQQYYTMNGNKKLSGDWIYLGQDKIGKEICEKA